MNCWRAQQLLSDLHDGHLTARRAAAMTAHLDRCPTCCRLGSALGTFEGRARRLSGLAAPDGIEARVAARWRAERAETAPRQHRRLALSPITRWQWMGLALATGTAIVLVVAGDRVGSQRDRGATGRGAPGRMARVADAHPTSKAPDRRHPLRGYPAPTPSPNTERGGAGEHAEVFSPLPVLGEGQGVRAVAPPGARVTIRPPRAATASDDLAFMNRDPVRTARRWIPLRANAWTAFEARLRRDVRVKDDFVQISLPRLADATGALLLAAAESYKREAAVVDARLFRKVALAFKATALSDLCDHLRSTTGVALLAGSSVADEKVTVFCKEMPLRDVMRQLSRPFGYAWVRSGQTGEYKYELVQDLRSQLLEEELRDRDRRAALLALEKEIERFRPYLSLPPDELLARAKKAAPAEKKLLEKIAGDDNRCALGWGPVQMYFRLSASELQALRAGEELYFSDGPRPGERPLPPDVARGVLQGWRGERLRKNGENYHLTDASDPDAVPVTAVSEARATVSVRLVQTELGQYGLTGDSGFYGPAGRGDATGPYAVGMSPRILRPENGAVNAAHARDPAMQARISVQPQPRTRPAPATDTSAGSAPEPKTTSAEVLEALHRVTGMPIIADYYTRLYKVGAVTVRQRPIFQALNHVCDTMGLRWNKEALPTSGGYPAGGAGAWLQVRSTSFYDDRLKEVPNRLLDRWSAARRRLGMLSLDDLIEIAGLSEDQLKANDMAEGAREIYGLMEWDLARNHLVLWQLRFMAQFTPAQRQEAQSTTGLPFTRMSLAQQQGFLATLFPAKIAGTGTPNTTTLGSLEDLAGATLRVDYTQPGWYEWRPPGLRFLRWLVPQEPGSQNKRAVLRPVVRERTREAALAALRRLDPKIREAARWASGQFDPRMTANPPSEAAQIVPTDLDLATLYVPGSTDKYSCVLIMSNYYEN